MGIKDLFFESNEETNVGYIPENFETNYITEEINTEVPDNNTTNFIDDVYNSNHLEDISKSIFKVEELTATLPSEMATNIKQQTVLGIMSTVGLLSESVIDDGILRIQCLENAKNSITDNLTTEIQNNENTIESLKVQIAELQKDNAMKQAQIISIKNASDTEVNRIKGLIDFVGGTDK